MTPENMALEPELFARVTEEGAEGRTSDQLQRGMPVPCVQY
jgi:hypothetical protein